MGSFGGKVFCINKGCRPDLFSLLLYLLENKELLLFHRNLPQLLQGRLNTGDEDGIAVLDLLREARVDRGRWQLTQQNSEIPPGMKQGCASPERDRAPGLKSLQHLKGAAALLSAT